MPRVIIDCEWRCDSDTYRKCGKARMVLIRKHRETMELVFRDLWFQKIFATVQKLSYCESCKPGDHLFDVSGTVTNPRHEFTNLCDILNKQYSCCTSQSLNLKMYLGFDFESADVQACALAILKKRCRVDWNGDHNKLICVSVKVPPSVHWAAVRSWVRKRSIAIHWQEQTAHLYAADGVGRKRDREAFEGEFVWG